jgi:uncharacterized repeat protein (TIGR03806 family)
MSARSRAALSIVLLALAVGAGLLISRQRVRPQGLERRIPVRAYLNLPPRLASGGFEAVDAFPGLEFDFAVRLVYDAAGRRYFVCEREGRVWSFAPDGSGRTLVLDLSARTQGYSDSGLLGLALHPQFGKPGAPNRNFLYVWFNYSERPQGSAAKAPDVLTSSVNRLSRFTLPDGAARADPASELVLIDQPCTSLFHNGGGMFFHPGDGYLYLGLGDDENLANTQQLDGGLFSGVIRIDVDQDPKRSHPIRRQPRSGRTANYGIPNDNPFQDPRGGQLEEFWAIGFRNPHALSFDRPSGRLWAGELGNYDREEVNLVEKGGNYQWPYREGRKRMGPPPQKTIGDETLPVYQYAHGEHKCVIGGFVYRGEEHPDLYGDYVFGDNASNAVWALAYDGEKAEIVDLARVPGGRSYRGGIASFGEGARGEVLILRAGPKAGIFTLRRRAAEPVSIPATLSATGLFDDVTTLAPGAGVVPYDVNVPQWADGATARRFIAVADDGDGAFDPRREQVGFSQDGAFELPPGTVIAQHLELALDERDPARKRALETRVLVRQSDGEYYGLSYRWRPDGSDADLVAESRTDEVEVTLEDGSRERRDWTFPGRGDCLRCHSPNVGSVLGVNARQLNRAFRYPAREADQLTTWSRIGLFRDPLDEAGVSALPRLSPLADSTAGVEERVRSYLDANCAHCHNPGGVQALFDARHATPLAEQRLVDGPVLNPLGMEQPRVVAPGDAGRSLLYFRLYSVGEIGMPPVAKNRVDQQAVDLVAAWIRGLPPSGSSAGPSR